METSLYASFIFYTGASVTVLNSLNSNAALGWIHFRIYKDGRIDF